MGVVHTDFCSCHKIWPPRYQLLWNSYTLRAYGSAESVDIPGAIWAGLVGLRAPECHASMQLAGFRRSPCSQLLQASDHEQMFRAATSYLGCGLPS